jgi:phage terminase large subunit-like protein
MLMFGMRLGADPRTVVTTTPRPAKLIRDLVRDPIYVVTRGSSSENRGNLAPAFSIRSFANTKAPGSAAVRTHFRSDTAAVPRVIPSCYRTPEFDRQTFS